MVEITNEEFVVVFEALRLANTQYSMEEVAHGVAMEAKAWDAVQAVKGRSDGPA